MMCSATTGTTAATDSSRRSRHFSLSTLVILLATATAPATATSSACTPAHMLNKAHEFVAGHNAVVNGTGTWADMEHLIDADAFVWNPKPASIGGGTDRSWAEFGATQLSYYAIVGGFTWFHIEHTSAPLVDADGRRVVFFITSTGESNYRGAYGQEYVITVRFDAEGKVIGYEEFLDSLYTAQMFATTA